MKWTNLRQMIEAKFAPELSGCIQLHTTRYRFAHDHEREFWVTLDGAKIYGSAYYQYLKGRVRLLDLNNRDVDGCIHLALEEIESILRRQGISDHWSLQKALFESLNQPLDDMLASSMPLIRAIAIMDVRFGKRRLEKLDVSEDHELVKLVHQLRSSSLIRALPSMEPLLNVARNSEAAL